MKTPLLCLALGVCGFAGAAFAQEAIPAGPRAPMPAAEAPAGPLDHLPQGGGDPEQSPEAIGAWARGVLAGAPASEAPSGPSGHLPLGGRNAGCGPPDDGKPHGEVWAGAGTGGYREAGGVVTKRLGDCAEVTVGVDSVRSDVGRHRR